MDRDNSYAFYVLGPPWLNENLPVMRDDLDLNLKLIIHGSYNLPEGYELAVVPSDGKLASHGEGKDVVIASTYSGAKALVAAVQTVYAGFTLFQTRGDQLSRYGYAAFGLTVIPYLVMSVLNSLADALTPTFPACYLVRSDEMDEAERREGCYFEGIVGRLLLEETFGNRLQSDWKVVSVDDIKVSCQLQLAADESSGLAPLIEAYHC